jgi:hypothetical protein
MWIIAQISINDNIIEMTSLKWIFNKRKGKLYREQNIMDETEKEIGAAAHWTHRYKFKGIMLPNP